MLIITVFQPQPSTPTRTIAATPSQMQGTVCKREETTYMDDVNELEELELFAKAFKQRRIKLGFTQVGFSLLMYFIFFWTSLVDYLYEGKIFHLEFLTAGWLLLVSTHILIR